LIRKVPERRVRTQSITSQKGEWSIDTVSSGVPDRRMPKTPSTRSHATSSRGANTSRSRTQKIVSSKPAIEPRENVTDSKQKGEARVECSITLGVEAK